MRSDEREAAMKETINKIKKYNKNEIIAALERLPYIYDDTISRILLELQDKERSTIFEQMDKAEQKVTECIRELSNWRAEVVKRYGDGNSVRLADLPTEENEKGAALERALKESIKARDAANKREKTLVYKNYIQRKEDTEK